MSSNELRHRGGNGVKSQGTSVKSGVMSRGSGKHVRRDSMIITTLKAMISSVFFHQFIISVVCFTLLAIGHWKWWWLILLPLATGWFWFRPLAYESLLILHAVGDTCGSFEWYSAIDENIFLGAIPLSPTHISLMKKLGVSALITLVEPFELAAVTLVGNAVQQEEWQAAGIEQVHLSCRDFIPPPHEILNQGWRAIDRLVSSGKKVYVHCKSGRGRSASVVAAYLMKVKGMSAVQAQAALEAKRSIVFKSNSRQMKNLLEFEAKRAN